MSNEKYTDGFYFEDDSHPPTPQEMAKQEESDRKLAKSDELNKKAEASYDSAYMNNQEKKAIELHSKISSVGKLIERAKEMLFLNRLEQARMAWTEAEEIIENQNISHKIESLFTEYYYYYSNYASLSAEASNYNFSIGLSSEKTTPSEILNNMNKGFESKYKSELRRLLEQNSKKYHIEKEGGFYGQLWS